MAGRPVVNCTSAVQTGRTQSVVINNSVSYETPATPGVLQGSVLRPLLILIYINDLRGSVRSTIRMLVDDCIICKEINNSIDPVLLQQDLTIIGS